MSHTASRCFGLVQGDSANGAPSILRLTYDQADLTSAKGGGAVPRRKAYGSWPDGDPGEPPVHFPRIVG